MSTELVDAINHVERIARLLEKNRIADAEIEFFHSDCHKCLIQSLNEQEPRHLSNPMYRYLYGLLSELARIKKDPEAVSSEKIRDYCRDIEELLGQSEKDKGGRPVVATQTKVAWLDEFKQGKIEGRWTTQAKFAELKGVSPSTVSQYFADARKHLENSENVQTT